MTYGTLEGSVQAAEMEPVEVFEFASLKHEPSLKASSKEWHHTIAWECWQKDVHAHLKIQVAGKTQNIRLVCGGF